MNAADLPTRTEHDLIGDREVPVDAYWGIHTLRAQENFPISGVTIGDSPFLVEALACVKQAAALTNHQLGLLDDERFAAIEQACEEIRAGDLHDQFVVDVMQGGAGTSTNMNANEVIANRALEILGRDKGDYGFLHPNEHVNLSQSTNDVYPTAIKIAVIKATHSLLGAMEVLQDSFAAKADEFRGVLKMGRTQLQDAVPMTLGQEFGTYAVMLGEDRSRLSEAVAMLHEINLGATAIGTQLNAPLGKVPWLGPLLGFVRAEYSYRAQFYLSQDLDENLIQAPTNLVNLRGGVRYEDDRWEITLWAQNLANEAYNVVAFDVPIVSGYAAVNGPPRTWGATVRYRWY